MARYQITAPDGRVVTVEGDTDPTEQDAAEIFASLPSAPAAGAAPAPAAAPAKSRPSMLEMMPAMFSGGAFTLPPETTMESLQNEVLPAAAEVLNPIVSGALRVVPPVAAGILTAPAQLVPGPGTAANLGAVALGAGIGDRMAQIYENTMGTREGYSTGETAAAVVGGALPFAGSAGSALPAAARIAGSAALLGGGGVAAETTRTLIDEQRFPTTGEAVRAAAVPIAFGAGMGAAGAAADWGTALTERLRGRAAIFTDAGVTPTPGMINPPDLAAGEAARAAGSTPGAMATAARVEGAYQQLGDGLNRMAGNTAEGATLMKDIRPLVTGLRDADDTVTKLSKVAQAADARAAKATRDYTKAREAGVAEEMERFRTEYAQAADDAFQAKFQDVVANARELAAARLAPDGPGKVDPATARDLFAEHVVAPLRSAWKTQGEALYGLVDGKAPVFKTQPVLDGLKRVADEVTVGAPWKVKEALDNVRSAFTDKDGNLLESISLNQLRNIRDDVAPRFGQGMSNNEQRLLTAVRSEITSQIDNQAPIALGGEGADMLRQANAFYRSSRELFDAPGVKALVEGDASDSYVRSLIEGMGKSGVNSDEYRNVARLTDAIGSFDPALAQAVRGQVNDTVRQSVLFDAGALDPATGGMRIDTERLAATLGKLGKVGGTLEALGLGTPRMAAELQTLAKKYPHAGKLTGDEWAQLFDAPAFAEAAGSGRFATAIEPFLAARSVQNRLQIAANLEKAGKVLESRRAMNQALTQASAAGQSVAAAQAQYSRLLADPAMVAFNNPKLSAENFNVFANALFDPGTNKVSNEQVATMMAALRRSPNPANQALASRLQETYIRRRMMEQVRAPAKGDSAFRLDVERLREFSSPENLKPEMERARAVLSADQLARLEKFFRAAREMSKYEGHAGTKQATTQMRTAGGQIKLGSQPEGVQAGRGGAATVTKGVWDAAVNLYQSQKYNLAAHVLSNPSLMTKAAGRLDTVAGFINTVGAQRAILLALQNPGLAAELEPSPADARLDGAELYAKELIEGRSAFSPKPIAK